MKKTSILFVCTGNICRSPTAEGVARAMAMRMGLGNLFEFDSAGTLGIHAGEAPDARTVAAAKLRGYDLSRLRARRLTSRDFNKFDWLLAMDAGHLDIMRELCPPHLHERLCLFLDFHATYRGQDVPDPYYGGPTGFEQVLDLVEQTTEGLLTTIRP